MLLIKANTCLWKELNRNTFDEVRNQLNRNEDFLYTFIMPDRASNLFPLF
jgi:hypothetical protein